MFPLGDRITIDPEICHGKPCIRGLRYPVEVILELLSSMIGGNGACGAPYIRLAPPVACITIALPREQECTQYFLHQPSTVLMSSNAARRFWEKRAEFFTVHAPLRPHADPTLPAHEAEEM